MVGMKIILGNGSVPQVVGMSSSINLQNNADRLDHVTSLKKHLLRLRLKLILIIMADLTKQK